MVRHDHGVRWRWTPLLSTAAVVLAGAAFPSVARSEQIAGVVFNDFNTNGVRDTGPGAVDRAVAGVTVRAFTGARTAVASAVTGADGAYAMDVPNVRVRVELEPAGPWWPTRQLEGLRSDVQFVDARTAQRDVDFAVHRVGEFSIDNPLVFWPTQWAGSPADRDPDGNHDRSAIRGIRYYDRPDPNRWENARSRRELATFGEVGTIFGLGIDQARGSLYAGAYYKRFAGLTRRRNGTERTGAIFRITRAGGVRLWATLGAGPSGHPESTDIDDWVGTDGFDQSWDLVGKRGLGSVKVDLRNRNVYTVNLFDKRLYRLPIGSDSPLADGSRTRIPDPGCTDGDWRPFAIGIDPADGRMYVGGVCSAETSQEPANLRAVVYGVGSPASASPTFTRELDVPLDYRRVSEGGFSATFTSSGWRPWPPENLATSPPSAGRDGDGNDYGEPSRGTQYGGLRVWPSDESYPQLAAIAFDADGSMILGLRDLMGDMAGFEVQGEVNQYVANRRSSTVQGDLLRAVPSGSFTLESGGDAGRPGFGWTEFPGPLGPGGGYFYDPRSPEGANVSPSGFQGGTTQVPGFAEVMTTSIHINREYDNGLVWYPNDDGTPERAEFTPDPQRPERYQGIVDRVRNHMSSVLPDWPNPSPGRGPVSGFGKANGLGDLESYRKRAPVQIGNRLWYDRNRDGLQGARERPVTGAVVELVDGAHVDSTRTDALGEYVFAIEPGVRYRLRVPLDQPQLDGWRVTRARAGSNDRIDSNGRARRGYSVASVSARGVGENNHAYDFGFQRPRRPPATPPTPPGTDPPPPEDPPEVAGEEPTPLMLVKLADRDTAEPGDRVRFTVMVRNPGPDPVRGVRVCDRLPEQLVLTANSRLGRRVAGRRVCWGRMELESGETRKFRLTTRVGQAMAGAIVNRATATAGRRRVRASEAVQPVPRVTG